MLQRALVGLGLSLVFSSPALAQQAARHDSVFFAWQSGDYVVALQRAERYLNGPQGDALLEPIALLTGELYPTREIAPDGSALRWSRDGRMASYTTAAGPVRTVHLVDVSAPAVRQAASLPGFGFVFSPARDEGAYLAVVETAALKAARGTLDSLVAAQDFQGAARQRQEVSRLEAESARLRVRDLATGRERDVAIPGLSSLAISYGSDGSLYLIAGTPGQPLNVSNIYAVGGTSPKALTDGPRLKTLLGATSTYVVFSDGQSIGVRNLATGETRQVSGRPGAMSADGSAVVYIGGVGTDSTVNVLNLATGQSVVVKQTTARLANPAISGDGKRVAWQMMTREDWEIYTAGSDGTGEARLTREIQHDWLPQFLGSGDRVLALIGEPRHRRSYLYEVATRKRIRLHHNNTIRTVAPEYEWALSPDGSKLLIVADRDGNTISPERGVYLMDLSRTISKADLLARVRQQLAAEQELRRRGERNFAAIADRIRPVVADVSVNRVYTHYRAINEFDSRWMASPGNQKAVEYFVAQLKSWGYEPEVQWFEPRPGIRTANVVATLRGTVHPDRTYVVSGHFDSVQGGPGMDDNLSGTVVMLEAARALAGKPQPATIKFAFLTGEEAGTLGAREFVRRAREANEKISGALNNDMVGWANDERIDNTIRYSSAYLRDIQHAAAIQFSNLITYDAKYYRGTDAGPFYEAWGEIVAGMGGFPILGSPHYHQSHDVIETVSFTQVAETAKATIASVMFMAQQPELPRPAS